jgi:hypothetical protein
MIVLVTAIECLVAGRGRDLCDPVSLSWRYSTRAARVDAPGCELLCVGDSLIKHGLVPSIIQHETGWKTTNLSAARAPTLMTYFLLRRALDAGARPRAIILNAKPAVLLANPEFNLRYWQEVLSARECAVLLGIDRRANFAFSLVAGRLLPSLRARLEVRSSLRAAILREKDPVLASNHVLWRNWTQNAGANISPADFSARAADINRVGSLNRADLFFVDPSNFAGIESLVRLASERSIHVYWLLTPLAEGLQTMRDASGAEAEYERFIRSFQEQFPHIVTVLDARRAGFQAGCFADPTHLNRRGAIALSDMVSRAIVRDQVGTAARSTAVWTVLDPPPHHLLVPDPPLEDLDQSRRILGRAMAASN